MNFSKFEKKREPRLDDLMESCLKTKDYEIMYNLLKQVENTYDRFEYYMEKIENAKTNNISVNANVFN